MALYLYKPGRGEGPERRLISTFGFFVTPGEPIELADNVAEQCQKLMPGRWSKYEPPAEPKPEPKRKAKATKKKGK